MLFFVFEVVWTLKGSSVRSVASLGCNGLKYIEKNGERLSGNRKSRFSAGNENCLFPRASRPVLCLPSRLTNADRNTAPVD